MSAGKEAAKGTALVAVWIGVMVGLVLAFGWFVRQGVNVAVWALPWLQVVNWLALGISVVILAPLALFRKTRAASAIGFQIASYSFGLSLWLYGLLVTYAFWGAFGVLMGLVLLGVGVVPVALVATVVHSEWGALGEIALGLVLTFGARLLSAFLIAKTDPKLPSAAERMLRAAQERREIISDFGAFIERNPSPPTRIEDVSVLPHPKERILEALLLEIPHQNDPKMKDWLKVGATFLAQYQPGVGEEPLEMLGMDISKFPVSSDPKVMQAQIRMMVEAEAKTRPRYEGFNKLVTRDLKEIEVKIAQAERSS